MAFFRTTSFRYSISSSIRFTSCFVSWFLILPFLPPEQLRRLRQERAALLAQMRLTEEMLVPQYRCKKCSDTGFDKNGNVCDCYRESVEDASDEKKLENILDVYSNIDL